MRKCGIVSQQKGIAMTLLVEEIPDLFIDIDYIPADLLFLHNKYARFIYVRGKKWEINFERGYPFYERYKPRQLKEQND